MATKSPKSKRISRSEIIGDAHGGIATPHVHTGGVRPAQPNEVPSWAHNMIQ